MRGGYRQNAGRKKGFAAKNAEEARKLLSERVAEEIDSISSILISQAKKGDIRAIKELFDRAWGRPQQAVQIASDKGLSISYDDVFSRLNVSAESACRIINKHLEILTPQEKELTSKISEKIIEASRTTIV